MDGLDENEDKIMAANLMKTKKPGRRSVVDMEHHVQANDDMLKKTTSEALPRKKVIEQY